MIYRLVYTQCVMILPMIYCLSHVNCMRLRRVLCRSYTFVCFCDAAGVKVHTRACLKCCVKPVKSVCRRCRSNHHTSAEHRLQLVLGSIKHPTASNEETLTQTRRGMMTTASCADYSQLLTPPPPPPDCSKMRAGPVTALLYDDFDSSSSSSVPGVMPLHHHRGPYNLTRYTPNDLRHHHQQLMQQQQLSSSSYQFSRTPVVVDGSDHHHQSSTSYHDSRQQLVSCTAPAGVACSVPAVSMTGEHHAQYASQRCDALGSYPTAATDRRYNYSTPSCLQPPAVGGGVQRPMTATQQDVLSPAYSPYSAPCLQSSSSSSSRGDLLMRTMAAGCCVTGYCAPSGPCHCAPADQQLYDHDSLTINGRHMSAEHIVSCRLQQQQQQHPHQSAAGTYKWMMIKRSTPKTTPSAGLLLGCVSSRYLLGEFSGV